VFLTTDPLFSTADILFLVTVVPRNLSRYVPDISKPSAKRISP
jgi:hypothetical protein